MCLVCGATQDRIGWAVAWGRSANVISSSVEISRVGVEKIIIIEWMAIKVIRNAIIRIIEASIEITIIVGINQTRTDAVGITNRISSRVTEAIRGGY